MKPTVRITCACGARWDVAKGLAGKRVVCPTCHGPVAVPTEQTGKRRAARRSRSKGAGRERAGAARGLPGLVAGAWRFPLQLVGALWDSLPPEVAVLCFLAIPMLIALGAGAVWLTDAGAQLRETLADALARVPAWCYGVLLALAGALVGARALGRVGKTAARPPEGTCGRCGKAAELLRDGGGVVVRSREVMAGALLQCATCAQRYCGRCSEDREGPVTFYKCPNCGGGMTACH